MLRIRKSAALASWIRIDPEGEVRSDSSGGALPATPPDSMFHTPLKFIEAFFSGSESPGVH
jgi:hypothetical protein